MAKVHKQDREDEDPAENPEADLDIYHAEDSYAMQEADCEELIKSHGSYSATLQKWPFLTISPSLLPLPIGI